MSDIEDPAPLYDDDDPLQQDSDDLPLNPADAPRRPRNDYDDDEEDDEEDEDEEDDSGRRSRKKAKHRHKRSAASRFLDIEAEVSDDEEEEEEEEEEAHDTFIETAEGDEEDSRLRRSNALLNQQLDKDLDDQDLAKIAQDLSRRYGRAAVRYTGDMNQVPQRLLMPSVHDANLWQVRVKPGRERDIVFSLMRKSIDVEFSAKPLQILSAFQRDSLPGMIYVEARSSQQVLQACAGLVGVFPSRGAQLVPIEEMASLLQIKKQDQTVTPGTWVRIRRGKYAGDLAQVMDVTENGEDVGLKFVPRIDFTPRDENAVDGKRRKKNFTGTGTNVMRPPQRFFNFEEVVKVWGRKAISKRNQVYVFQNDTYKDGFIEKDFKLSGLILENVNPTLDEITQFTRGQDGAGDDHSAVDLSVIAEASRKAAIAVLQPGDHIEVFEGEQAGMHGVVEEIQQDVVTITAVGVDIDGQKVDLPARSVRKRFKPGDHVKVMTGQNADETGLVVSVSDNIVTFLSDMSMQEVSVFSKDLREAAEVGSGTNIVGNYELHDLVQLDVQTVGVIFKTERDSFRVLDQNGQTRLVQPHQISMRRDSNRAIATDAEGHELRINDNMKEVDGEQRKGRVLHIHQSYFAFLFNREIALNGGVFVARARALVSLAPKSNAIKIAGLDTTKQNPSMVAPTGGMVGSGNMGRGPRDRLIGVMVVAIKGARKGHVGMIKDMNGPMARVEFTTNNKVMTINKDMLKRKLPDGRVVPLEEFTPFGGNGGPRGGGSFASTPNPYGGGATPRHNMGKTPNPYASGEGRTPAWNASSRTPNPYADGGRTPGAWNPSSKTPNPYASGGGDAWNAGSKTPNPYATTGGWGGATPGRNANASGWGGATPRAAGGSGWGGATPGRNAGWGDSGQSWSLETSWGAPTPASVPTPYAYGATPAPAQTPFSMREDGTSAMDSGTTAQTPAFAAAQTPAFSGLNEPVSPIKVLEELKERWLFEPVFSRLIIPQPASALGTYCLNVIIKGTTLTDWRDGDLENKKGYIVSALDLGSQGMSSAISTASVHVEDGMEVQVPVQYVVWEAFEDAPTSEYVFAVSGQRKGSVLRVASYGEDETEVKTLQGVIDLVRTEHLLTVKRVDL